MARIIGASSWAAQFVTRHPLLLDELLDDRLLYAPPELEAFAAAAREQLAAHAGDTERRMNVLREAHQAQVFRLLAQDLAGLLTVERLADHLSAAADVMLELTIDCAWRDLPRKHVEGAPHFAVIAYGKLGGKELGYASDLDIIFLYHDSDEQAGEVYARLAQRINHWLTSRTSSGVLFETDLELRPSGASGLLVSSLEAFARYQERDAWRFFSTLATLMGAVLLLLIVLTGLAARPLVLILNTGFADKPPATLNLAVTMTRMMIALWYRWAKPTHLPF